MPQLLLIEQHAVLLMQAAAVLVKGNRNPTPIRAQQACCPPQYTKQQQHHQIPCLSEPVVMCTGGSFAAVKKGSPAAVLGVEAYFPLPLRLLQQQVYQEQQGVSAGARSVA
jgi:hypothetical protein